MTKPIDVVNYGLSLVGKKVRVPTNPYGGQCISLIDHIVQHFTDDNLNYTNAIDALDKAASNGFPVTLDAVGVNPKAASFYVLRTTAHEFGHIGMAVTDSDGYTLEGIEQNVDGWLDENGDGINDQLQEGGGGYTRRVSRVWKSDGGLYDTTSGAFIGYMVGWFDLPYDKLQADPQEAATGDKLLNKGDYFIDVSAYQPADLTGICSTAGTFKTIIKVTEGDTWLSDRYQQQADTSTPVGYYHFARFGGSVEESEKEFNYFISHLPSKKVPYLVCDYEDSASADIQSNTQAVIRFMDLCSENRYIPILYTYKPYLLGYLDQAQILTKYPNSLWIAGYPDYQVRPDPLWDYQPQVTGARWWQFTSVGIAGGLDKNVVLMADEFTEITPLEKVPNFREVDMVFNSPANEYVAITNGFIWGISDNSTVLELEKSGHKRFTLSDKDYKALKAQAVAYKAFWESLSEINPKKEDEKHEEEEHQDIPEQPEVNPEPEEPQQPQPPQEDPIVPEQTPDKKEVIIVVPDTVVVKVITDSELYNKLKGE